MNTLTIEDMNTIERLQAMEMLWDALVHDTKKVASPNWHLDFLEEATNYLS